MIDKTVVTARRSNKELFAVSVFWVSTINEFFFLIAQRGYSSHKVSQTRGWQLKMTKGVISDRDSSAGGRQGGREAGPWERRDWTLPV